MPDQRQGKARSGVQTHNRAPIDCRARSGGGGDESGCARTSSSPYCTNAPSAAPAQPAKHVGVSGVSGLGTGRTYSTKVRERGSGGKGAGRRTVVEESLDPMSPQSRSMQKSPAGGATLVARAGKLVLAVNKSAKGWG